MRRSIHAILIVILVCTAGVRAVAQSTLPASASQTPAAVIVVRDQITEYTWHTFRQRVERARGLGAEAIIVELNTPGGALSSTLEITHYLRGLSGIRSIAFVNHQAYSAGTLIALACDELYMSPGGVIGDCAPIMINPSGGLQPLPADERAKVASPVIADFAASAGRNGYDPTLLEAFVAADRVVYAMQDASGQRRFVNQQEYEKLTAEVGWAAIPGLRQPVDGADTLLTLHSDAAQQLGLSKGSATSAAELAERHNLQILATLEPGIGEQIIDFLNQGFVRSLLIMVFMTSLYAALHAPGHGFAEVIAVIVLAALLGVPLLTGQAQWWEIVAILLGIALLALELFVIPGFGVAGIAGLVLILGGLVMTFVAPEPGRSPISIPQLPVTWAAIKQGLLVTVVGIICSLLLSMWLRRYLPKLPYFNRLILTTTVGGSDAAMVGSLTQIDPMQDLPAIGSTGMTITDLKPGGSVEFRDIAGGLHIAAVVSDSGFVPRGTRVVVREAAGSRILVRPLQEEGSRSS